MCLITFAWNPTPKLRLLVVANRDEFHARPSAPLAVWAEQPDLIAGRDIEAQGTWLGLSTQADTSPLAEDLLQSMAERMSCWPL